MAKRQERLARAIQLAREHNHVHILYQSLDYHWHVARYGLIPPRDARPASLRYILPHGEVTQPEAPELGTQGLPKAGVYW